jgi:hypothetical protein
MTVLTPNRMTPAVVDEMGEGSFPASDPPAVWTWDVEPAPTVPVEREPDPAV